MSAVDWTRDMRSLVRSGAIFIGLWMRMNSTRSTRRWTGWWYPSSMHCDHNEIIMSPIAAGKFSLSRLNVRVDVLSRSRVESGWSGLEGNANVAKRSNVLGSSASKR